VAPLSGALAVYATSGTNRHSLRGRLLASLPRAGVTGALAAVLWQEGGAPILSASSAAAAVFRMAGGVWECPLIGYAGQDVAGGVRVGAAADWGLYGLVVYT
jgi:hypothetical protein